MLQPPATNETAASTLMKRIIFLRILKGAQSFNDLEI
jgi:hypothetical protein